MAAKVRGHVEVTARVAALEPPVTRIVVVRVEPPSRDVGIGLQVLAAVERGRTSQQSGIPPGTQPWAETTLGAPSATT